MLEIMTTELCFGMVDFLSTLIATGAASSRNKINLFGVESNIDIDTKLDRENKHFHMTINLDILIP